MRIKSFFYKSQTFAALFLSISSTISTGVLGHAIVIHSNLNGTALIANEPAQIILDFNSQIELSLSKIYLVSEGDAHQEIDSRLGSKAGQIVILVPALEPGNYAIHYKVFAADGHLTEDVLRFSIADSPGD